MVKCTLQEMFENIKEIIRRCKSKKDRQYNGQNKKDKKTTMVYNYTNPTKNRRTPVFWEGKQFLLH